MMIYTSYFGNMRNLPENSVCISISRYTPYWYTGYVYDLLAPSKTLLQDWIDHKVTEEQYIKIYREETLQYFNPLHIYNHLDIAELNFLLCYETPNKFCHRHIVSEWINEYYECPAVTEWNPQ